MYCVEAVNLIWKFDLLWMQGYFWANCSVLALACINFLCFDSLIITNLFYRLIDLFQLISVLVRPSVFVVEDLIFDFFKRINVFWATCFWLSMFFIKADNADFQIIFAIIVIDLITNFYPHLFMVRIMPCFLLYFVYL